VQVGQHLVGKVMDFDAFCMEPLYAFFRCQFNNREVHGNFCWDRRGEFCRMGGEWLSCINGIKGEIRLH
jgi:hypothetical protein